MAGDVRTLKPEELPIEKVIASAVNITVGLAPDRQIVFSTGFEADEADSVINARFDRIMRMADRLKGHYEIPDIEEDLARSQEALANLLVDLERIDKQHDHAQASRRIQLNEMDALCEKDVAEADAMTNLKIVEIQQTKAAINAEGLAAHQRSGKVGSYMARGQTKANLDRCEQGLESLGKLRDAESERLRNEYDQAKIKLQAEIDKAEAERELHRGNQAINIERHKTGIADLEKKLARARALAGG